MTVTNGGSRVTITLSLQEARLNLEAVVDALAEVRKLVRPQ